MSMENDFQPILGIAIIEFVLSGITNNYYTFECSIVMLELISGFLLSYSVFELTRHKAFNGFEYLSEKCRIILPQVFTLTVFIFIATFIIHLYYSTDIVNLNHF